MGKGTKHARDWNETPLQVLIDARNLYIHSVRIMGNPKHFNPADDFHNETLYLIQRELLHVYVSARAANRINVTKEPWRAHERLALQDEAITSCDVLEAYFDLVKPQFRLDSKKFWYWMDMFVKVSNKMKAWHKCDVERYGELAHPKDAPSKTPLLDVALKRISPPAEQSSGGETGATLNELGLQPVAAFA